MKRVLEVLKKPLNFFLQLSIKKKVVIIVVVLITFTILNQTIFKSTESGYVTEPVEHATITQTVSETGNVDSGAAIEVESPSTGLVDNVYVENGQQVAEGDVLFTVKSSATVQEQQAAYSNYLAASAALNTAKSTADTLRASMYAAWDDFRDLATNSTYETDDGDAKEDERLAAEFQISQDTWTAAESKYKDQQTAIAQSSAAVTSTWLLYQATQDAEVKATNDGKVTNLAVSQGGDVTAQDIGLIVVPSEARQIVHIAINEIDVPKIEPGQNAIVEIDAIDDVEFSGTVERVDSIGTNTQGVITYNVYIALDKFDPRIKSAMTANVDIETETKENALSVPNSAVKLYQGGRAVQVLDGGEPKYIPVKVGIRGDTRTEILEGVEAGTQIITGARNELIQREGGFGF